MRGPQRPDRTTTWLHSVLLVIGFAAQAISAQRHSQIVESLSPFPNSSFSYTSPNLASSSLTLPPPPPDCPPCSSFNCVLPAFPCLNTGSCNPFDGKCVCPPGYGGDDCSKPLCGSLADGQNRFPRKGDSCECDEGWGGINCNVCQTNKACSALVLRDPSTGLLRDEPEDDSEAVCYKEGYAVKEMFQVCDVTNRKILDMLPDRPPQVTFTCDVPSSTCGFQFWIGQVESFYCGLSNCTASIVTGYEANSTTYDCEKVECACIPGRMLCGEDGSVDISEFLTEEIKGPSKFSMKSGQESKFEEPAMNQLINDIFGDSYITLQCQSGECMHVSEVPGFSRPPKPNDQVLVIATIAIVGAVLLLGLFLFWYFGRGSSDVDYSFRGGQIRLPNGDSDSGNPKPFSAEHVPAALQFSSLSYILPSGKTVLDSVTGSVQPGEIMAIIGSSGAGKSTLLDLLARKVKRGTVSGQVLVNGQEFDDAQYRKVVGFVDQEDTLMGTLTVYETILYSALLRLPRDMELSEKKFRVLETMHELGILGIRDSRIGESGERSISGGEKRRVSIACELVTSPSILFLDEPTSGLDSYNAFNVVECLVQLSRTYKRTVVFTIHQPRSNIVALFDKLILLASGKLIYSGKADECQSYFTKLGFSCPPGFNIADYLIDLTMQSDSPALDPTTADSVLSELIPRSDTEQGLLRRLQSTSTAHSRPNSTLPSGSATPLSDRLASLVDSYSKSDIARETKAEIESLQVAAGGHDARDATAGGHQLLNAPRRPGWWAQFTILSGRSFKNLYRNPMLMLSHYVVSVVVACICAFLFSGLTADIPGFQNRLGLFFFILAVFGFGCLTTLNAFASERLLFTRERANGYYSPLTYFAAKLLFDIVPLRVIPPFVLGAIIYGPIGLVATVDSFWRFILVLVLFNLTASSAVLLLGMLIKNSGVANLIGSLVMLFNLLFAGLLINKDKLPASLQWLETFSFFHAAFEALLINEVRYLSLKDHRYGVDIEVPAATILSLFGFQASAFWFPDISLLVGLFVALTGASCVALVVLVKERR